MTTRKIIHLDLDAFFCAVEELLHPELRGKPFAVGGQPDQRGVVASCSYAARKFGIHSAMPMSRALRICPDLIVVSSSHRVYGDASEKVMAILGQYTPLLEQVSIDEAFLDVSDLREDLTQLAKKIQAQIDRETNLPCSLGVASNKLVAKIACDYGKAKHRGITSPRAITVVPPGGEAEFLAPLPVQALWGVGPKTAARLVGMGIRTVGELANQSEDFLSAHFGKFGHGLYAYARGIDDQPVITEHEMKSISQEITFEKDVSDESTLLHTLRDLSTQVAYRLRKNDVCAAVVKIKIRWSDFSTHTRQVSLPQATDQDKVIYQCAQQLFESIWSDDRPVRLIGVGAAGLNERLYQLSLFEKGDEKERRLLEAVDTIREKFGKNVLTRAENLEPDEKHQKKKPV